MESENALRMACRPVLSGLGNTGLLLLGVAALVAALSVAGLLPTGRDSPTEARNDHPREALSKNESDFRLVQLGTLRRDQFLLDRRAGRVWRSVCAGETDGANCDGMTVWEEMLVEGIAPKE